MHAFQGFFFFFLGTWGSHLAAKILPIPQPTAVPAFYQSLSPSQVLSPKISNILPHFSLSFDYFFGSKLHQKALLYAQNIKICSNFAVGGHFGLSRQFFYVPLHLTPFPT